MTGPYGEGAWPGDQPADPTASTDQPWPGEDDAPQPPWSQPSWASPSGPGIDPQLFQPQAPQPAPTSAAGVPQGANPWQQEAVDLGEVTPWPSSQASFGHDRPPHEPFAGDPYAPVPQAPVPLGSAPFGSATFGPAPALPAAIGPVPPVPPTPKRRRRPSRGLVAAAVACLLSGLLGGGVVSLLDDDDPGTALPPIPAVPAGSAPGRDPGSVAAIAARVLPSVVALRVTTSEGTATGSGFVIRADGYLLTNNHVVAGAPAGDSVVVTFQDGTQVRGRVVGKDSSYDLAVVKIGKSGLVPLALADSSRVLVGDPVVAVGAPLGLQGTVTTGIVSALHRPVVAGGDEDPQASAYIDAVQTDAAINPGNSGGPLLDASGTVIGINSAIARASADQSAPGGSIGLGFAIPSNQARRTSEQLIREGKADHPVIGVLLDRGYQGEGVKISERSADGKEPVTPGGPGDRAGLRPGDVIVAVNGRPVAAPNELVVAIRAQAPGDAVRLTVRRDGRDREVKVTLDAAGS